VSEVPGFRFVFVGGAPRSGTTLVQRVLAAHPKIYGGPEFDLMPEIAALHRGLRQRINTGRVAAITDSNTVDTAFYRLVRDLFEPKATSEGCSVFSEKTPANVLEFEALARFLPGARFVFVIRDPRAIVASMLEVGARFRARGQTVPQFTRGLGPAIAELNRCWRAGLAAFDQSLPILPVFYEELVKTPDRVAQSLCAFLDLEFVPDMAAVERNRLERADETLTENWYRPGELDRPIDRESLQAFRARLSPAQSSLILRRMPEHPLLARYAAENATAAWRTLGLRGRLALRRVLRRATRRLSERLA
jgi:hypothetical protein